MKKEVDQKEYAELLELKKQKDEAQALALATAKKQDTLKDELSLTDIQCADMLAQTGMVKITSTDNKKPCMYVWNEETTLWENSSHRVNKTISSLLKPIAQKKLDELAPLMGDSKAAKAQYKKFEGNVKSLESATKLHNTFISCGDCMVQERLFNSKMVSDNLFPIRDGCIDLRTLEVRPREKEDYFNFFVDVGLTDETSDAERFLRPYCPEGDNDTYEYFIDTLSYLITPWNFLKKFFVFWGASGDNGKSVLVKVMADMLEGLYTSIDESVFTAKKKSAGGPTPFLAQCVGKFMGSFGETTTALLDDTTIKMITGDDAISYREMYGSAAKVTLFMKLLLVGNEKPRWSHNNPMTRRIGFFPFLNRFVDGKPKNKNEIRKDEKLVARMLKESNCKDQLFSLLVRNAAKLCKTRKLHKSTFIDEQFQLYISEIDTTTEFIENVVRPKEYNAMTIGEIFDQYRMWCSNNNVQCEKKGIFSRKFKQQIKPRDKKHCGNTVFDVEVLSDKQSVIVTPEKLEGFMREEMKGLMNDNEELENERDLVTAERDEVEKTMYEAIDLVEEQQAQIRELQKQLQKLYKQGANEKHYQKGIYANVAKQAQSMMAHKAKLKKVIKIV